MLSKGQTEKAIKKADRKLWTQTVLNIWNQPGDKAKKLGEVDAGLKVLVTGRSLYGRDEIVLEGKSRWVTRGYLTSEKPFTLGGACTNGTSVESGVSENIRNVHAAVCAEFPEITVYGTLRGGGGDHGSGHAVDIMVSGDRGWQVAEFVRKYYVELGVSYVIYSQNIWSVERAARVGAVCRAEARPRPTTTTTCTSRSSDPVAVVLGRGHRLPENRPQLRGRYLPGVTQVDLVVPAGQLEPCTRDEVVVQLGEHLGFVVVRPDVQGLHAAALVEPLEADPIETGRALFFAAAATPSSNMPEVIQSGTMIMAVQLHWDLSLALVNTSMSSAHQSASSGGTT